ALLVCARRAEDVGPFRPRILRRARVGRTGQQLELVDRARPLPVHGAETVGAGVAPADDDHALALRADELRVGNVIALAAAVGQGEVLHREVDAAEVATGDGEISRRAGA